MQPGQAGTGAQAELGHRLNWGTGCAGAQAAAAHPHRAAACQSGIEGLQGLKHGKLDGHVRHILKQRGQEPLQEHKQLAQHRALQMGTVHQLCLACSPQPMLTDRQTDRQSCQALNKQQERLNLTGRLAAVVGSPP